jgi:hypothetical protein
MSQSEAEITHKELLTFSNLTNLEWEFVDLKAIENGTHSYIAGTQETDEDISTQLNDLLDPEVFVKYDDDSASYSYSYPKGRIKTGENTDLTDEEKEQGLAEMRKNAGIAMEYLEKSEAGNTEGDFLNEWEVIYAADNYKVMEDFLKNLYAAKLGTDELSEEQEKELDLPTKKQIRDNTKEVKRWKLAIKGVDVLSKFVPTLVKFKYGDDILDVRRILNLDNLTDDIDMVLRKMATPEGYELMKSMTDKIDRYWALSAMDISTMGFEKLGQDNVKNMTEESKETLTQAMIEEIKEREESKNYPTISMTKKPDIRDTGFRVLVLRKGSNIVIAYKGSDDEEKRILPKERDLLQLVYARIYHENAHLENLNIVFTGHNDGGDFGFISSLLYEKDASLFYSNKPSIKEYLDFTFDDINKDYKTGIEIATEFTENLAIEGSAGLLAYMVLGEALIPALLFFVGIEAIKFISTLFKRAKIKRLYKKLDKKGWNYIKNNKEDEDINKIKGIITKKIFEKEYQKVRIKGIEDKIRVKKEVAFYLVYEGLLESMKLDEEGLVSVSEGGEYKKVYKLVKIAEDDEKGDIYNFELGYDKAGEKNNDIKFNNNDIKFNTTARSKPTKKNNYAHNAKKFISSKETKLKKAHSIINVMKLIYKLQKSYLEQKSKTEFIYCDLEAMLDDSSSEKDVIKISNKIEELPQKDSRYKATNEFVFMPYLNQDGNIEGELKLRDDYLASVFKSMFQKYKECEKYGYYKSMTDIKDGIEVNKYGLEENPIAYAHDFVNDWTKPVSDRLELIFGNAFEDVELNEEFIRMIEDVEVVRTDDTWADNYQSEILFNYHKFLLEKLNNDKNFFKKCCKVTGLEEEKEHFIDSIIILNPEAKANLEYKYNPEDHIIGGELELYAEDIPVESTSKKEMPSVGKIEKMEEGKAIKGQDQSIKAAKADQSVISDDLFNKVSEELKKGHENSLDKADAKEIIDRMCEF